MGVCLALTGPCPLADKHCQLAAGLHSLAMCSLLINRTHSRRQVQANTKPFPWAAGFSSCLHRCQLKRILVCYKAVRPLWGPLWKVCVVGWGGIGGSELITVLFLCFCPYERSFTKQNTQQKSCAWLDNLECTLKRTGNGNCPLYEVYLSIFFFFLLVLSGFWKVEKNFSCVDLKFMALSSFWLDSCFSEMGNITWVAALYQIWGRYLISDWGGGKRTFFQLQLLRRTPNLLLSCFNKVCATYKYWVISFISF